MYKNVVVSMDGRILKHYGLRNLTRLEAGEVGCLLLASNY
jgi:hypothetical protein